MDTLETTTPNQEAQPSALKQPRESKKIYLAVLALVLVVIIAVSYFIYNNHWLKKPKTDVTDVNVSTNLSNTEVSINPNSEFNPTYVAGILKYSHLSRLISSDNNYSKYLEKTFSSANGKFMFKYPSYIFATELPTERQADPNTSVLITANSDDLKKVEELKKCMSERQPNSESICDIGIGDYFVVSIYSDKLAGFFHEDYGEVYQNVQSPIPGPLDKSFLSKETAFMKESIPGGEAESSVTQDWINLMYNYKIKIKNSELIISGYASPSTWPYRQTISSIINSFNRTDQ